jgi:hydrogenase maturation factor
VLLPEGAPPELPLAITDQIVAACAEVGATPIGGHTEMTAGLPRPIIIGAMPGEVAAEGLITTGGARPGDALLLTRGIAIEGTALIATEFDRERAGDGAARTGGCRGRRPAARR